MTDLRTDRLGQGVGHRPVGEGTDDPSLAVHREIARGPYRWSSDVTGEDRVLSRELIEHACDILGMNGSPAGIACCQFVQALACLPIVLE